jgi:hypothetical protein
MEDGVRGWKQMAVETLILFLRRKEEEVLAVARGMGGAPYKGLPSQATDPALAGSTIPGDYPVTDRNNYLDRSHGLWTEVISHQL